jgi:hypothetical protein
MKDSRLLGCRQSKADDRITRWITPKSHSRRTVQRVDGLAESGGPRMASAKALPAREAFSSAKRAF